MDDLIAWLRREVERDRAQARDLIESEAASPAWSEPVSGVLYTGPPTHDDTWAGTYSIGDSRITRFIAARDPQWVITDCEAKLAILDTHPSNGFERYPECSHCAVESYPCRTVRLLGSAYQYRPGYQEAWKP